MLIISYAFSLIMLTQPEIFKNVPDDVYYRIPSNIFQPEIMGWLMIISATIKLVGRLICKPKIKLFGLVCLNNCWAVTAVSLFYRYLNGSQSATFLLCFAMVLVGFGQAIRGDYSE
ncbi:hypothetical protein MXZ33_07370 [Streptococcus uberis]|nr:hypothetical protein [Streptococcus uberis]MCK1200583.1 hypothetical protein [Streptococcus uberis]